jgi:hypothetical protein
MTASVFSRHRVPAAFAVQKVDKFPKGGFQNIRINMKGRRYRRTKTELIGTGRREGTKVQNGKAAPALDKGLYRAGKDNPAGLVYDLKTFRGGIGYGCFYAPWRITQKRKNRGFLGVYPAVDYIGMYFLELYIPDFKKKTVRGAKLLSVSVYLKGQLLHLVMGHGVYFPDAGIPFKIVKVYRIKSFTGIGIRYLDIAVIDKGGPDDGAVESGTGGTDLEPEAVAPAHIYTPEIKTGYIGPKGSVDAGGGVGGPGFFGGPGIGTGAGFKDQCSPGAEPGLTLAFKGPGVQGFAVPEQRPAQHWFLYGPGFQGFFPVRLEGKMYIH